MEQVTGGVDESGRFFPRQNDRQPTGRPGIGHFLDRVHSLQCLAEKETQRRRMQADGANAQFALLEQVDLIGAKLFFVQLVRRTTEMPSKILHDLQVRVYGSLRVITTLSMRAGRPAKPHENHLELRSQQPGAARSRTQWR